MGMTRYRAPHRDEDSSGWLFRLFIRDDLAQARRWGGIAAALFVISGTVVAVASPSFPLLIEGLHLLEFFWPISIFATDTAFGTIVILGWVGLAMWPAYRKAGVLVSWSLLVSPMWGALLTGMVLYNEPGGGVSVGQPFWLFMCLIIAISLGTCGFLLGTGLRRILAWNRNDRRV